jgi:hypothetical protein
MDYQVLRGPDKRGCQTRVVGNKEKDTVQDGVAEASNPM